MIAGIDPYKLRIPVTCFGLIEVTTLVFILTFPGVLFSQSVHESLKKGDRQYNRDNFKAAEKQYRIAADLEYSNPKALNNLGNSLYQQGNWENAAERFDQAARFSKNSIEQANALHNLGNAHLKQRKFKEAVAAYENSLRLRPGDADSKTNLQMAKQRLKEEEAQKQQQNQQNPKQPKDDNPDKNQPQPPEDKQSNQPQQPQDQPQQNQSGQPQQPNPQQDQPQMGKMKKEEAQRILETAVGPDDQRNARKYRSAQPKSKPKGAKKDW